MKIKLDTTLVRRLRQQQRLSQEEFAIVAGVGVRTVQRAETGGVVSLETARAIASALGKDVAMIEENSGRLSEAGVSKLNGGAVIGGVLAVAAAVAGGYFAMGPDGAETVVRSFQASETGAMQGLIGAALGVACAFLGVLYAARRYNRR